jgi:hypothetical protein
MAFGLKNMEGALEEGTTEAQNTAAAETETTTTEETTAQASTETTASAETTTETTASTETTEENQSSQEQSQDIDEDKVRVYFKTKYGKDVTSFEELFQEKAPATNPYENISPELKKALEYNLETGRGLSDYQQLQRNIDDIPVLDLAIAKTKESIGMEASDQDIIEIIEEDLGIDLSGTEELSTKDKLKLNKYVKEYKEKLVASQEKFKTPLEKEKPADEVEMITLDNGQKVEKPVFEQHQKERQIYLEDMKVAVDSVAKTSLSIEFDNNGTKENYAFDYEFDQADKKSMLELTEDIDKTAANLFRTEKGLDHQAFAKSIWRLDPKNWEKEVAAIVNKAIADNTERLQKSENNINFSRNRISNEGTGTGQKKDIFTQQGGFGVKFNLPNS